MYFQWLFLICSSTFTVGQIPNTNFKCVGKTPGFYADDHPLSGCSVYHLCGNRGRKTSFACPAGTLFRQQFLVCAHAHEVNCSLSSKFYYVNAKHFKLSTETTLKTTSEKELTTPIVTLTSILNQPTSVLPKIPKTTTVEVTTRRATFVERTTRRTTRKPVTTTTTFSGVNEPSMTLNFPPKRNYLLSNNPVNPSCPLCEPFYLNKGSCTPCIIIR